MPAIAASVLLLWLQLFCAASAFPATLAHPTAAVVALAAALLLPLLPLLLLLLLLLLLCCCCPCCCPWCCPPLLLLQRLDRRSIRLALKCINATVHNDIREEALVARPDLVTISSRSRHDLARRCSQDHTHWGTLTNTPNECSWTNGLYIRI